MLSRFSLSASISISISESPCTFAAPTCIRDHIEHSAPPPHSSRVATNLQTCASSILASSTVCLLYIQYAVPQNTSTTTWVYIAAKSFLTGLTIHQARTRTRSGSPRMPPPLDIIECPPFFSRVAESMISTNIPAATSGVRHTRRVVGPPAAAPGFSRSTLCGGCTLRQRVFAQEKGKETSAYPNPSSRSRAYRERHCRVCCAPSAHNRRPDSNGEGKATHRATHSRNGSCARPSSARPCSTRTARRRSVWSGSARCCPRPTRSHEPRAALAWSSACVDWKSTMGPRTLTLVVVP
ncbi:hypothetical protein BJ912DRAFT_561111 [Pholiota molesta]|nr:hypothetical protein BJ912DRAFT_561111 [Pholiota molesta]